MNRRAETVRLDPTQPPKSALLAPILRALADGELVALPTETVYGLAARADHPEAPDRLARIKGRDPSQPLTWHIGSNGALERLPQVSAMARRLVERYWPGPLTLVLPGVAPGVDCAAKNGWTGVRRPAHAVAQALLESAEFPIVATSANWTGRPPLTNSAELEAAFGDELAYVIDSGPPRLGEGSVVLAVGPKRFELLREGILDLEALRSAAGLKLGFVCTGNTCRSPMAEGLARQAIADRLQVPPQRIGEFGFDVVSMGVFASIGAPASAHSIAALEARGIDISGHRSHPTIPEEIAQLDRVYALTHSHLDALTQILPPGRSKHCSLLDPDGRDISDPIGGPRSEYEAVAEQIRSAVLRRLDEWV